MALLQFFLWLPVVSGSRVHHKSSVGVGAAFSGSKNEYPCGDGMKVKNIPPPWEDMDSYANGAASKAQCELCGKKLQDDGHLKPNWECYTWFSYYYIKRKGELTLGDLAAKASFNPEKQMPLQPGTAPLPPQLRGLWWLTGQGESSALMTFAPNGHRDCEWCSYGSLLANRYLIRVAGQCVWSFAMADEDANWGKVERLGLLYDFSFDSSDNPKYGHIYPHTSNNRFLKEFKKSEWLLDFDMILEEDAEQIKKWGYEGSLVWKRRSWILGVIEKGAYDLVQVVDEHGNPIEPAWSQFIQIEKNETITGNTPGKLWYRSCGSKGV